MFNHIMVGATDIEASKKFYDATLRSLRSQARVPAHWAQWRSKVYVLS